MNNKKVQNILLPLFAGLVLLGLLQTGVIHRIFHIKELQLPLPFDILRAFWENIDAIGLNTLTTLLPMLCGVFIGSLIGYATAVLVTMYPKWGYGGLFLMTLINSVPIVALAPLMNRWFEIPFIAKLVVIAVAASGTMTVNAYHGLNDLPHNTPELMRSLAASPKEIFAKLRFPNSLPRVFTALKIIIPGGMLAAIISEFFSSKTEGLGYMIKYCLKVGNMRQIGWAYILAVAVISILLYILLCLVEKKILKWHVSQKIS